MSALEGYQGSDFRAVNKVLRGMPADRFVEEDYAGSNDIDPASARDHLDKQIELIDDVMDVSKIMSDIRVLRGTETGRGIFGDRLAGSLTGFEWTEDAFVSTTVDPDVVDYFTTTGLSMEILVPAGTGAVNLSGFRNSRGGSDEAEVLLQRGLRMRVVSDTGPGDPRQLKVVIVDG